MFSAHCKKLSLTMANNSYIMLYLLNCCLLIASISAQCSINIEGWYWREFSGSIPVDAFQGVVDLKGKHGYIGKVLSDDRMMPAKIFEGDNKAYFDYGGAQSATDNIMILCTENPEKFEWVSTTLAEIHLLTGRHLMVGGFDAVNGGSIYIGRAAVRGENSIGKILTGNHEFTGFWTVKGDTNYNLKAFDVLVYNPNKNSALDL